MGELSEPVAAAIDGAVDLVESLIAEVLEQGSSQAKEERAWAS